MSLDSPMPNLVASFLDALPFPSSVAAMSCAALPVRRGGPVDVSSFLLPFDRAEFWRATNEIEALPENKINKGQKYPKVARAILRERIVSDAHERGQRMHPLRSLFL